MRSCGLISIPLRNRGMPFRVKTASGETRVTFPLLKRSSEEGRFQGITRDDVIYLIMPDRFADGDPGNNQPQGCRARHLRS